ncbi:MAG: DEAD/DEAH box helicase [Bacillota bacterium]
MKENGHEIIFSVSPFLLGLGRVALEGRAVKLMEPLAGKSITVADRHGRSARCRVSPGASNLVGSKMADLLILNFTTGYFAMEQCGEKRFLIWPVSGPKKIKTSNIDRIVQTPLFPELPAAEPEGGSSGDKTGRKTGKAGHRRIKQFESEGAAPGSTDNPRGFIHGVGSNDPSGTDGPAEFALNKPPGSIKKPGRERFSVQPREKKSLPPKTITARQSKRKAEDRGRGAVQIPSAVPAGNNLHKIEEDFLTEPVKVVFFPEEDAFVLREAEKKGRGESPAADLILHRQALQLSLSPGFDRLLALSLVRDVAPLDYQLKTVRHVLTNLRGRALLCDEVGLGKTIEAGLIMLEYILRGLVQKVLLLVPPSLVEQWQQEMQNKFKLDFIAYDAPAFKNHPSPWKEFPRIIASLDTAKRESNRDEVLNTAYDLVVVDEAHHLKNHRTLAYQLVNRLEKKYILLLTATPVENNLEELFNLITLLQPGQLETASSFKRKYITRGDPLKPKNTAALKQLIREVMIRNRRSETGVITSRRLAEVVELNLSAEEMAFYQRLTVFVRGHYTSGFNGSSENKGTEKFILKMLQREVGSSIEAVLPTLEKMSANDDYPAVIRRVFRTLAEQAGSVPRRRKAEALLQLLAGISEKVIVFTSFQQTHSYLVDLLRRQGLNVAQLHGGLRRLEKEEQLRLFAGEARVLVSTDTGSEGRNLHFCNVLINYDLPWNPMRIEQRIGRIHRLGQAGDVRIYNLSAAGTVESHILELLDAKINMFQLVVGELDMILGNLNEKREFEDVIMDIWVRAADEGDLKRGMEELGRQILSAKEHYMTVRELDDRLLGELRPDD